MQTIEVWLKNQKQRTQLDEINLTNHDLQLLLEHLLGKNRAWIYTHPEYQLTPTQIDQLTIWLKALQKGKPMAYITEEKEFWNLIFKVNSHTLIPRPDSEILIETVIELHTNKPPQQILDLGTGSGALAIVLASIYPNSDVLAIDQSVEALAVAKHNSKLNQVNNVTFKQSDWFGALNSSQFNLIISNPPYIAANDSHMEALRHEPIDALVADQNGLENYIRITARAKDFLVDGGLLIFEHGWQQREQVQNIFKNAGFQNIGSRKDFAGNDRVTFAYK